MLVKHSYDSLDVMMLLKDLTGEMKELPAEERERAIQSGVHYSEMLPKEKEPSAEYAALYERALSEKKRQIAGEISTLCAMIEKEVFDSENSPETGCHLPVIISLARAGIPVGVLIRRYFDQVLNYKVPHFAISIIRDKGIDENAMEYIYKYCMENNIAVGNNFIFVDGWTGKGAIKGQLTEAVEQLKAKDKKWAGLTDNLYVLADPANITKYCGTHEDYLIPCSCLNSTCAGLISRTILNSHIGPDDFHGAVYFEKFEGIDKSREFVDTVSAEFENIRLSPDCHVRLSKYTPARPQKGNSEVSEDRTGMDVVMNVCRDYHISDYKKVKPGIGETTRVLLRRIPNVVLINTSTNMGDKDIEHLLVLCKEKNIPIERYPLGNYKVCGVIKELSDV